MAEDDFLHAVLIEDDEGRDATPGRLSPPSLVVTHAVIELERVDLEEIKVHHESHSRPSSLGQPEPN